MLKEQINFYTPKVFSVLIFFIRPARVWVIRYSVTAVLSKVFIVIYEVIYEVLIAQGVGNKNACFILDEIKMLKIGIAG